MFRQTVEKDCPHTNHSDSIETASNNGHGYAQHHHQHHNQIRSTNGSADLSTESSLTWTHNTTVLPHTSPVDPRLIDTSGSIESFAEPRVFHRPPLPPTVRSRSPAGSPVIPFQLSQVLQPPSSSFNNQQKNGGESGRSSPVSSPIQFTSIEQILASDQSIRHYLRQLRQHSELDYQLLSRVLSLSLVSKSNAQTQTSAASAEISVSVSTQTFTPGQTKETQTRESRILSTKLLEAEQLLQSFRLHQLDPVSNKSNSNEDRELNESERAQLWRNLLQLDSKATKTNNENFESHTKIENIHIARPVLLDWPENQNDENHHQQAEIQSELDSLSTMETLQDQSAYSPIDRQLNAEYRKLRRYLDKYERQRVKLEMLEHGQVEVCNGECSLYEQQGTDEQHDLPHDGYPHQVRLTSGQTLHFDEYHQPVLNEDTDQSNTLPVKRVRLPEQHQVDQVRLVDESEEADEAEEHFHDLYSQQMHISQKNYESKDLDDEQPELTEMKDSDEQINSMLIVPEPFQDKFAKIKMEESHPKTPNTLNTEVDQPLSLQKAIFQQKPFKTSPPCVRTQSTILIELGDSRRKELAEISSRTELSKEGALSRKTSVTSSRQIQDLTKVEYEQPHACSSQPIITSPSTTAATTPSATLRRNKTQPPSSGNEYRYNQPSRVSIHSVNSSPLPPISRCDSALDLPDSASESNDHTVREDLHHSAACGHVSGRSNNIGMSSALSESALHSGTAADHPYLLHDRIQMGISEPIVSFDSTLFQQSNSDNKNRQKSSPRAQASSKTIHEQPNNDNLRRQVNNQLQQVGLHQYPQSESRNTNRWRQCSSATVTNELRSEPLPEQLASNKTGSHLMALSTETNVQTSSDDQDLRRIETKSRAVRKYDRSKSDNGKILPSKSMTNDRHLLTGCTHCGQKKISSANSRSMINELLGNCRSNIEAQHLLVHDNDYCAAKAVSAAGEQLFSSLHHQQQQQVKQICLDCAEIEVEQLRPNEQEDIIQKHQFIDHLKCDCEPFSEQIQTQNSPIQQDPIELNSKGTETDVVNYIDIDGQELIGSQSECNCNECGELQQQVSVVSQCPDYGSLSNDDFLYLDELRSKPESDSGISSSLSHRSGDKNKHKSVGKTEHSLMFNQQEAKFIEQPRNKITNNQFDHGIEDLCNDEGREQKQQLLPVSLAAWTLTPEKGLLNSDQWDQTQMSQPTQTEIMNRITKTKIPEYEYKMDRNGEQKRCKVGSRSKLVFEQQLESPAKDAHNGPCQISSLITMDIPRKLRMHKRRHQEHSKQKSEVQNDSTPSEKLTEVSEKSENKINKNKERSQSRKNSFDANLSNDESSTVTGPMSSLSSCSSFESSSGDSHSAEDEINTQTKFQRFRPVLITGNQKQTTWEYSIDCACRNGINASVRTTVTQFHARNLHTNPW